MAATYNGKNTIRIYENGAKVGSADVGKPSPQDTSEVHIGGWQGTHVRTTRWYAGTVSIFSVALSEDGVKNLMKKGFKAALEVALLGKLTTTS